MKSLCFCILSVLAVASVTSAQNTDINHIRVFPSVNQSVAGVFQVTRLNDFNQPHYAFNASEARLLCLSLGVHIASKAQVETALTRGFETCRFGWIDEYLAVIPRIRALINCGKNQTGLVPWRASVKKKFDVFCFNESDPWTQLKDTATDRPLNSSDVLGLTNLTFSSSSPSSPDTIDEAEPARSVGSSKQRAGGKVVLITCTCVFLLIAAVIIAYLKLRQRFQSSDEKQQKEYIETEDWTVVTRNKESQKAVPKKIRIEEMHAK
ncbi:lymphatic vessel endothelial hyaluronic acid receptor 1a isoform X2 [Gouania willdenowi]|uniref:Link domain-containing protein n=1 Tax=Gouania willdenowi TaxID=441366 RepID=A0A8C5GVU8_GOUWI|nr:lymphatic vessel endothelial hyaluronic acid receptor 1 isoform X2 [Gouania willdenowi]